MSRRSWLVPALCVLATGAVVAAGTALPEVEAATSLEPRVEPLTGALQVCPHPTDVPESTSVADGMSLPDTAAADEDASGQLALRTLPGPDAAVRTQDRTSRRGVTVSGQIDASATLAASGALAPGTVGEVTTAAAGERTAGLASVSCVEPQREWWFLGGDGGVGRRGTLVLGNSADGPAVVDVEIWTEDGPLRTAGANDLGVPARGTRSVSIDAVASGSERVGVRVQATVGKVGAAMVVREVDGADPIGLSWVSASEAPATLAYVPGVPAFGDRALRLLNPGEEDAIVGLRVLSGQGPFTPVGLEAIDVPALTVVDVDLEAAGEEAHALEVTSSVPVVSALRATQTPGSGLGDFAIVGSTPTLDGATATRVSGADGRSARLVLTALPDPAASPPTADATPPSPDSAGSPDDTASEDLVDVDTPTTQVTVRLLGLDGTALSVQVATVALGTTDPFPVELPSDVSDAWLVVEPDDEGRVLAARELTTTVPVPDPLDPDADREAFWLDITPLRTARATVSILPVVSDLSAGLPFSSPQSGSE